MNFFVRSSVDNYSTNVGGIFTETWNNTTSRNIDLSGAAFQNLADPVTFRFYVYESEEVDTNQGARWDNIVLTGNVTSVPEVSALGISSICGTLLLLRRNRNSQKQ